MRSIRRLGTIGVLVSIIVAFGGSVATADVITGDNGPDSLSGTNGADTIWAYSGDDYAEGLQGRDTLHMADGEDIGHGNPDADDVYGGSNDNGAIADFMYGGGGDDELFDTTSGNFEKDRLYGDDHSDRIHMDDGDGLDYGFGGPGDDTRTKDDGDIWHQD